MSNELRRDSFPITQQEVSRLRQTATDAVNDLGSAASSHAPLTKGQLKDLAGHSVEEGGNHLDQVKGTLRDLVNSARNYASARPLVCLGAALAVGFLIGLSRRGASRTRD